jgi:transposase
MRKVREVLRLLWDQQRSVREVAVACGLARSTVQEYERRARGSGLVWPLPEVSDSALESMLFPSSRVVPGGAAEPDWVVVANELATRRHVTRRVLWEEYREKHPDGYAYSRYCELFAAWRGSQEPSMRMVHVAGERVYVDYAGVTMDVVDRDSGEVRPAQLFVAAFGASHYTFAEATWTQALPDWIASHSRMLAYFQGRPRILVPDNLKAGVKSAHLYEPDLNPTYLAFAQHHELAVIPARAGKAKDKAVVESAVQVAERWILARLRHRTFFSLESLNAAIAELLEELNDTPFQKRPGSRRSVFLELDRPALRPLLAERFVLQEWSRHRAHIDYHVTIDQHRYSVPHQLIKQELDVRATSTTIEVFFDGERVASHARSYRRGGFTTVREHMPPAHQEVAGVNQQSLLANAARVGPAAREFAKALLDDGIVPQQGYRSLLGILRLERDFGRERLNAACERALTLRSFSYKSVQSILKRGIDRLEHDTTASETKPKQQHENLRGHAYYSPDTVVNEHDASTTSHEPTPLHPDAIEATSQNENGAITC